MKVKFTLLCILAVLLQITGCQHKADDGTATNSSIDSLVQKQIDANHIAGAVIQVKKGNDILHRRAYGYARKYSYELELLANPESMATGHLFDLASLTKVMATTFGIMKLVDEGKVKLEDPVDDYLPAFKQAKKSNITIRHLLTHTSGLPQWKPIYYHVSNPKEITEYIAGLSLKWEVGQERHYSDLGFVLLSKIIEEVSGMRLDSYMRQEFYDPLDLKHTAFNPLEKGFQKIASTSHGNPFEKQMVYDDDFGYQVDVDPNSWDGWREYTLHGEVNDGNAWYAGNGVAGHAGLFSTVDDLQVLADLLINKGRYDGNQLLSPAVIDTFLAKDQFGNGLGWAMDKKFIAAEGSPAGTFGHTGFTGTSIVVVPQDSLSIILLTNRQHAGRQADGSYIDLDPLRQAIFAEVEEKNAD